MEAWAIRVQNVRRGVGMTQGEFARALGVSVQTIVGWEKQLFRPYSELAEWFIEIEKKFQLGDLPVLTSEDEDNWKAFFEAGD